MKGETEKMAIALGKKIWELEKEGEGRLVNILFIHGMYLENFISCHAENPDAYLEEITKLHKDILEEAIKRAKLRIEKANKGVH